MGLNDARRPRKGFSVSSRSEAAVQFLASRPEKAIELSSIRRRWCAELGFGRGSGTVWVPVGRGRCGDTDRRSGVRGGSGRQGAE